jgi:hypothetical protein
LSTKGESLNHHCLLQRIGETNASQQKGIIPTSLQIGERNVCQQKGIIPTSLQIGGRNVCQQKGITQPSLSSARDWKQDVSQQKGNHSTIVVLSSAMAFCT